MKFTVYFFLIAVVGTVLGVDGDMGISNYPLTDGSSDHPWRIEDFADFEKFANNSSYWQEGVHTKLTKNIDLDPSLLLRETYYTAVIARDTTSNTGSFSGTPFSGVFDGNGFAIKNMNIGNPGEMSFFIGLFGKISGSEAVIKNLTLLDVNIVGGNKLLFTGALCGQNDEGTITNCSSSGSVSGITVGGLCGDNKGTIQDSSSDCSIEGNSNYTGGLCGQNYNGTITDCFATGAVDGQRFTGGLCGYNYYGAIENCFYYSPNVALFGGSSTGGLCGHNQNGTISKSYANCPVYSLNSQIGGLCGSNSRSGDEGGTITDSFHQGMIVAGDDARYVGGLCGENYNGIITSCFSSGDVLGGDWHIGGLLGGSSQGMIFNCQNYGAVIAGIYSESVGGVCGSGSAIIYNCSSSGQVDGQKFVGGVCGSNSNIVENSKFSGSVTGVYIVGGVSGENYDIVKKCYSEGQVGGTDDRVGGVCGTNYGGISNCYSISTISGNGDVGGICGYSEGGINSCYFAGSLAGGACGISGYQTLDALAITSCVFKGTTEPSYIKVEVDPKYPSPGHESYTIEVVYYHCVKTPAEIMTKSTFIDLDWDFIDEINNGSEDIWRMCSDGVDCPKFAWEYALNGDLVCGDGVDVSDLMEFSAEWLAETHFQADINLDNKVNLSDLLVISKHWLE